MNKLILFLLIGVLQTSSVFAVTNLTGDVVTAAAFETNNINNTAVITPSFAFVPSSLSTIFSAPFNNISVNGISTPYMPTGTGIRFLMGPSQLALEFTNFSGNTVTFPDSWTYQITDLNQTFAAVNFNGVLSDGSIFSISQITVNPHSIAISMVSNLSVAPSFGWNYTFDITTAPPVTVPEPSTYISLAGLLAFGILFYFLKLTGKSIPT